MTVSNDSEVTVVHFATSENITAKNIMFPQCNIHKYANLIFTEKESIQVYQTINLWL